MKALRIIQVLVKILRILCIVGFITSIVGAALCALTLIIVPITKDVVLYEDKTMTILLADQNVDINMLFPAATSGLIACGVSIFLCKWNELFFKEELEFGTPFRKAVVKSMRKTAIINIIATFAMSVLIWLAYIIFNGALNAHFEPKYDYFSSVGFGIALLVISLFCEYGAEISEEEDDEPEEPEQKDLPLENLEN